MLDADHHPAAIDIADLEPDRLGRAKPRGVGGGQRGAGLQAWNGFEKANHLVGTQHHRQLARLPSVGNALRNLAMPKRDAIEEPQRTDRLVQRRPRDAVGNEMDLKGAHVLKVQPIRRAAKIPTELRDGVDVGSLRRRRQIADRHVLDHAAAQRAHLGHRGSPVLRVGRRHPRSSQTGDLRLSDHPTPATAGSFNTQRPARTTPPAPSGAACRTPQSSGSPAGRPLRSS